MSLPLGEKTFFGQPRALATLFFTEMWERFSYYGMRAILVLYLITPPDGASPPGGGLGFTDAEAAAIYGTYVSLIYLLPLLGGWVADRLTGPRRAVLFGGIVIAAGHFVMAVPIEALFWTGLLVIAIGTGLLKPSVSAMVGGLYAPDDTRRDGGFSIFYMGINLGALIAPLIVGYLGEDINWHLGFAVAGVGMLIGLAQYMAGWKGLGSVGIAVPNPATPPERRRAGIQGLIGIVVIAIVLFVALGVLGLGIADITVLFTVVVIAIAVIYFWRLFKQPQLTPVDRDRLWAFFYLFLAGRRSMSSPRSSRTWMQAPSRSPLAGFSRSIRSSSSSSRRSSRSCGPSLDRERRRLPSSSPWRSSAWGSASSSWCRPPCSPRVARSQPSGGSFRSSSCRRGRSCCSLPTACR